MAIIKCKMCGGDIILAEDRTYGTCKYCGSTMTFPKVSDEQNLNLFNRANHFRRQNEFDKAIAAYDRILDQDDTNAEAHWGAVLSRYGIEYVEDPVSHERIPTCHRVQPASILTDAGYCDSEIRFIPMVGDFCFRCGRQKDGSQPALESEGFARRCCRLPFGQQRQCAKVKGQQRRNAARDAETALRGFFTDPQKAGERPSKCIFPKRDQNESVGIGMEPPVQSFLISITTHSPDPSHTAS